MNLSAPLTQTYANYNFADTWVWISGLSPILIKAFFLLFISKSPDTNYNWSTTYVNSGTGPSIGTGFITIPFFMTGNYQLNSDFNANIDYTQTGPNNFLINGN